MDEDEKNTARPSTSSNSGQRRNRNTNYLQNNPMQPRMSFSRSSGQRRDDNSNAIHNFPRQNRGHWHGRGTGRGRGFVPNNNDQSIQRRSDRNNGGNPIKRQTRMGFKTLEELANSDSRDILMKISAKREAFMNFINSPIDRPDVFPLLMKILAKACQTSFDNLRLKFIIEVCNSQFLLYLQNFLLNLQYGTQKRANNLYWKDPIDFWSNFIQFCECVTTVSPSTALRSCRALIEATSRVCLEGLSDRHGFQLPDEYTLKLTQLRTSLTIQEQEVEVKQKSNYYQFEVDDGDPPENFRELSVIPSPEELLEQRPFLRPNIVDGAYRDQEHYLDVQFRLLREDCYGPLREGINQHIKDPMKKKYDYIRVLRNVEFVDPFISQLKSGYLVQVGSKDIARFRKTNWTHSKRFMFGSLVLFTKDNCKTFLVGTILDRDAKYLSNGKIPVALVDNKAEVSICFSGDKYNMIESEVYFEPYYHVLTALKDPKFPEHLALSKYIVDVDPIPNLPRYLKPQQVYKIECDNYVDHEFVVEDEKTWPNYDQLGLNETQYEAFKLALTHEFAVIQGPPGTGKTFIGVKVATTCIKNLKSGMNKCLLLMICYTNHALDQFLEAILPVTESVARIGGQSRSEIMKKYNINELRHNFCKQIHGNQYFYDERNKLRMLNKKLKEAQERLHSLHNEVLSYTCVQKHVPEIGVLKRFYGGGNKDPLEQWLFEHADVDAELTEANENENEYFEINNEPKNNRDEFCIDDLDDDNEEFNIDNEPLAYVSTSFSLPNAISEMRNMQHQCMTCKDPQETQVLNTKIRSYNSHIHLFREMSVYRRNKRDNLLLPLNPTKMCTQDRWLLYFSWADTVIANLMKSIIPLHEEFARASEIYEETRMAIDLEILKNTTVIGMTTTGAARLRKLLQALAHPIIIVEEAAEVLEQHIITSLTRHCEHLILIGDHQQLRPSAAHMKLAKHYNIEVSLFERMINNNIHSSRLGVQHRMRPALAALISPHIYPHLQNHPSVENFPDVRGMTNNLFFLSHDFKEKQVDESSSKCNEKEGDLALGLANYLVQQDYAAEDVTILTGYSGQMFYLRKQRAFYAHLKDVKITVVDNYQGEESKIIILSLVRNNNENKIGFLGTVNRICVALSRAREGFYMFGNIDILKTNSELWEKIASTLENNGSLGSRMRLRCERHPEEMIWISDAADFEKSPEGGCMNKCSFNLDCGHQCPMICHGYDRGHANTKCTMKCERIICESGHVCPLACAAQCAPCAVPVPRRLRCGHDMDLPCHLDITDPSIKCKTIVTVTLDNCKHQAKKVCHLDTKYVICPMPCIYRVEKCGHQCEHTCHVNNDPYHEHYVCQKPCAKSKEGCLAGLVGDRGDHQCRRKCHEACDPCVVEVIKKRANCKHSELIACNKAVDDEICKKKCARTLPCGHFCKKKCYETCGDCTQMVTKIIPECGHKVKVQCKEVATRELCVERCERTMECGHACAGRCAAPCDVTACAVTSLRAHMSPCSHLVRLPCNIARSPDTRLTEELLLRYCAEPCGALLACGHQCGGTCSQCRQGRLHVACTQTCHQTNICGHQCEVACNQVCPPCARRCEVRCAHSQCSKLCGEPCAPCQEACSRRCEHGACARRCGEACGRAACDAPCARALRCGHACRGLCGEPCPDVCNICRPDDFPRGFIGEEYDDDAKFIQLQDCPHVMEVQEMDGLMMADKETIAIRTCPFCRKPIINTNRYKDLVNRTFALEINPVKERVYGTTAQIQNKQIELQKALNEFSAKDRAISADIRIWKKSLSKLLANCNRKKKRSLLSLEMDFIFLEILDMMSDVYDKSLATGIIESNAELQIGIEIICQYLITNTQKISQQQQIDIGKEIKRLNYIIQFHKITNHAEYKIAISANSALEQYTAAARQLIFGWKIFDEDKALNSLQQLQEKVKLSTIVSKEERDLIVKAIGLKAGHWYKCPNGHFYCIGECGGAMEVRRCECGAAIGGSSHTLLASNRHAPEMDGSSFPAWSNQYNNIANFLID
ncbi:PREDICTED: NFX1-type zinc finger-containing protein 1-like [Papilio polytes]|uniref:NFX1-type zinc finger-containing protein 1-like n=1 Tax=Papilio polytes TaxID=76194 RepID=UPI0006760A35|nr:PREDICTED: NFX1-type zinc finger-containing protein 1-like [Papilio polytes]XP_013143933.1 PREDICTED: NFX1-type zinc finger-containing protein 1-like [Papilio polytes]XP_013143934.1 PREDICTED: NFX1-type zinc finger-containing protein 1-like [Papilio polytes]